LSSTQDQPAAELSLLISELRETNALLRAVARPELRRLAQETLESASERRAFQATDGSKTTREVAASSGASQSSVSRWWRAWRLAGLVATTPSGAMRPLLTLDELGLPITPSTTDATTDA
jgi:hypothetical protein